MQYVDLCKTESTGIKAVTLHTLTLLLVHLCQNDPLYSQIRNKIMSTRYVLYAHFNADTIDFIVSRTVDNTTEAIAYIQNNHNKYHDAMAEFIAKNVPEKEQNILKRQSDYLRKNMPEFHGILSKRNMLFDTVFDEHYFYRYSANSSFLSELKEHLRKKLMGKNDNRVYAFLVLSEYMLKKDGDKNYSSIMDNVLNMLLESHSITEVETGKCRITISREELNKVINRL